MSLTPGVARSSTLLHPSRMRFVSDEIVAKRQRKQFDARLLHKPSSVVMLQRVGSEVHQQQGSDSMAPRDRARQRRETINGFTINLWDEGK